MAAPSLAAGSDVRKLADDPLARGRAGAPPADALRERACGAAAGVAPAVVERALNQLPLVEEAAELQFGAAVFGGHAPFRLTRERFMAAQARRLPPLQSSMLALDVALGREDDYDFGDVFRRSDAPSGGLIAASDAKGIHAVIDSHRLGYGGF